MEEISRPSELLYRNQENAFLQKKKKKKYCLNNPSIPERLVTIESERDCLLYCHRFRAIYAIHTGY